MICLLCISCWLVITRWLANGTIGIKGHSLNTKCQSVLVNLINDFEKFQLMFFCGVCLGDRHAVGIDGCFSRSLHCYLTLQAALCFSTSCCYDKLYIQPLNLERERQQDTLPSQQSHLCWLHQLYEGLHIIIHCNWSSSTHACGCAGLHMNLDIRHCWVWHLSSYLPCTSTCMCQRRAIESRHKCTMSILYDRCNYGMNNNFSAISCASYLSDSVSSTGVYCTCWQNQKKLLIHEIALKLIFNTCLLWSYNHNMERVSCLSSMYCWALSAGVNNKFIQVNNNDKQVNI